jgi:MFS family permease
MTTLAAEPKARTYKFAIPFLGLLAAVQGSAPFLSSTALVSVTRALKMEGGEIALAASIQTLAIAATVITTGLLADRLGRKLVMMAALVVSAAGMAIVAISPIALMYMLGQAVIGVGLGAVYGAAFAYVRAVSAPGKLPQALGTFGAVSGAMTVSLVFLCSALVGIDWRLAFGAYAAVIVIMFLLTPSMLPKQPRVPGNNDVIGQIAVALGIVGLLYGVSQLGASLTAITTWGPIIGGIALLAFFFIYESKSSKAFYPVSLFRSPVFWAAILAGFIYNFGLSVSFLQTTNLWQYVTKVPTDQIAIWQLPLNLFGIAGALIMGRMIGKALTNGGAILVSSFMAAAGFILLAVAHGSTSFWAFAPGTALLGMALTGASIPFGNLMIKEAPPAHFGPVTSSRTTIGQVWYSLGTALVTVMIDKMTMGGVTQKLIASGVQPDQISTATNAVSSFASTGTEATTALGQQALQDATASYGTSFTIIMIGTALLIAVAGVIAFALAKRGNADAPEAMPAAAPIHAH